ncbi:FCD domain-containing protein [Pokkaliibacter sp. MBI-7]|uniref:FadR/GntR family transcriptional regulator n=1 Tax=Pokkaliibacter sp. MBI-7 TaxID=3040600 RepID=UPI00244B7C50|nr:FCD domain-containing protein [Pokkaliibacter sp. MBI-7]MDH2434978.1 FCD domain-containing protein [Pokkaliibacter sp. MBI-7]
MTEQHNENIERADMFCISKADQLSKHITGRIISGQWKPGQLMASERQLAAEFEMSRAMVRESVTQLVGKGVLQSRHGQGTRVCNPMAHLFDEHFGDLPQDSYELQLAVLEMRTVIDGEAAWYFCQRASAEEMQMLVSEFERMEQRRHHAMTPLERAKADLTFHMLIAEHCHQILIISLAQLLYSKFFNAIYGVLGRTHRRTGGYPPHIEEQHRNIFQTICSRDAEAARLAAEQHILTTRQTLEQLEPGRQG